MTRQGTKISGLAQLVPMDCFKPEFSMRSLSLVHLSPARLLAAIVVVLYIFWEMGDPIRVYFEVRYRVLIVIFIFLAIETLALDLLKLLHYF